MNLRALDRNRSIKPSIYQNNYRALHEGWKPGPRQRIMYGSIKRGRDEYTVVCRACGEVSKQMGWYGCKHWREQHDKKWQNGEISID